jgi:hypothetical protein
MNTFTLLTIITVAAAAALFIALVVFLFAIVSELRAVGGSPVSYLAKIRLGLRAIEVQTGHIVPEVTKLNGTLASIRDGLRAVDANLGAVIAGVSRQGGR